jgi:hypothetical protein
MVLVVMSIISNHHHQSSSIIITITRHHEMGPRQPSFLSPTTPTHSLITSHKTSNHSIIPHALTHSLLNNHQYQSINQSINQSTINSLQQSHPSDIQEYLWRDS